MREGRLRKVVVRKGRGGQLDVREEVVLKKVVQNVDIDIASETRGWSSKLRGRPGKVGSRFTKGSF